MESADRFRSVQVEALLDGEGLASVDAAQQALADALSRAEQVGALFGAETFVKVLLVSGPDDPASGPTVSTIRFETTPELATDSALAGVAVAAVQIAQLPEVDSVSVNPGDFPLAAVYLEGDLSSEGAALVDQLQTAIDSAGWHDLDVQVH